MILLPTGPSDKLRHPKLFCALSLLCRKEKLSTPPGGFARNKTSWVVNELPSLTFGSQDCNFHNILVIF